MTWPRRGVTPDRMVATVTWATSIPATSIPATLVSATMVSSGTGGP